MGNTIRYRLGKRGYWVKADKYRMNGNGLNLWQRNWTKPLGWKIGVLLQALWWKSWLASIR